MKIKISSRDLKFFLFGIATMFIIVIIFDWNDFVKGFKDGYNDQQNNTNIENTK